MGVDFHNVQVFTGESDPEVLRQRLLAVLRVQMQRQFDEDAPLWELANRDGEEVPYPAVAIGPPGRWVTVFSTLTGMTEDQPAVWLSEIAPTVSIWMDDSAAVHFYQYRNGESIDQFANRFSAFLLWPDEEQQDKYQGEPDLWSDLLLRAADTERLREIWEEDGDASTILEDTAALLGWHPLLCSCGYTIDWDGIPQHYRSFIGISQDINSRLEKETATPAWTVEPVDLSSFTELHPDIPIEGIDQDLT